MLLRRHHYSTIAAAKAAAAIAVATRKTYNQNIVPVALSEPLKTFFQVAAVVTVAAMLLVLLLFRRCFYSIQHFYAATSNAFATETNNTKYEDINHHLGIMSRSPGPPPSAAPLPSQSRPPPPSCRSWPVVWPAPSSPGPALPCSLAPAA